MLSLVSMYAKVLKISEIRKYLQLNIVYNALIYNWLYPFITYS